MTKSFSETLEIEIMNDYANKTDFEVQSFENLKSSDSFSNSSDSGKIPKVVLAGVSVVIFAAYSGNQTKSNFLLQSNISEEKKVIDDLTEVVKIDNSHSGSYTFSIDLEPEDNKFEQEEVANEMEKTKLELSSIKEIETQLFVVGFLMGTLILISPLLSNVSFATSIPASLFGYSVMIPKLRSRKKYG